MLRAFHITLISWSFFLFVFEQVKYAIREYACRAIDVIARRTRLSFINVHAAQEALPRVIEMMGRELGWNEETKKVGKSKLAILVVSLILWRACTTQVKENCFLIQGCKLELLSLATFEDSAVKKQVPNTGESCSM